MNLFTAVLEFVELSNIYGFWLSDIKQLWLIKVCERNSYQYICVDDECFV